MTFSGRVSHFGYAVFAVAIGLTSSVYADATRSHRSSKSDAATNLSLESHARARTILDAAVKAVGGVEALREVSTVRRELAGKFQDYGQGPRPVFEQNADLQGAQSSQQTMVVDYSQDRWARVVQITDKSGDSIRLNEIVSPTEDSLARAYMDEAPFLWQAKGVAPPQARAEGLTMFPEGLLLAALDRSETLQWMGRADFDGRSHDVVSLADGVGQLIALYFDAGTHLLAKAEQVESNFLAGDAISESIYSDYRAVGKLKLPFHHAERVAGAQTADFAARQIELNSSTADSLFQQPTNAHRITPVGEPRIETLGKGLYLIRNRYNVLFAEFADHVLVFEAPLDEDYAQANMRMIRSHIPGKPIRTLVLTHFHFDHIGGAFAYARAGARILAIAHTQAVLARAATATSTIGADPLAQRRPTASSETITDRKVIDDGFRRIELYEIRTDYVDQMLIGYFPAEKMLLVADIYDNRLEGVADMAYGSIAVAQLAAQIKKLGLQVDSIVPIHGMLGTAKTLEDQVQVRAKYFGELEQ